MKDGNPVPAMPPNLLRCLAEAAPVVRQPRLGLLVDFDGTIVDLVAVPDDARISSGCAEALDRLSRRLALVAVVSGRSALDLRDRVGLDRALYVGNHGAEYLADGRLSVPPAAEGLGSRVKAVFDRLRSAVDLPGLIWQHKGLSASVHYRQAPDAWETRRTLAAAVASAPGIEGLEVFWGKFVLELRAASGFDKGYAVRKLARDYSLDAAVFVGDDTTDVDALRALRELTTEGPLRGLGVAVVYDDSPDALLELSSHTLEGVREVEGFLRWLEAVTR